MPKSLEKIRSGFLCMLFTSAIGFLAVLTWWLQGCADAGLKPRIHGSDAPLVGDPINKPSADRYSIHRIEERDDVAEITVYPAGYSDQLKSISEAAYLNLKKSAEAYRKHALRFGAVNETNFPMREIANEAQYLLHAEIREYAALMARKGYYETVPMASPRPLTQEGFRQVVSGTYTHPSMGEVEVVLMVPLTEPRIAAAQKKYQDLSAAADQEYVGIFNNQNLDARRSRWLEHLQAIQDLSDVGNSRSLNDLERARRRSELEAKLIDMRLYWMEEAGYWLRIRR